MGARLQGKNKIAYSAKECAYLAVFVALVIAVPLALSAVPGVEHVTVMFVAYSFTMGVKRGMLSATAFSLLRQIVFGINPIVLILYLVYFNLLTLCFALLGKKIKNPLQWLVLLVCIACVCTACFSMMDNILTPWWYGYSKRSARLYFKASLPFMIPQIVCTAVSVFFLFYPLHKVFKFVKKNL
jgi:energy-coupling factor transport system substrate-specific component/cob(I)alamin adenosyltransferase